MTSESGSQMNGIRRKIPTKFKSELRFLLANFYTKGLVVSPDGDSVVKMCKRYYDREWVGFPLVCGYTSWEELLKSDEMATHVKCSKYKGGNPSLLTSFVIHSNKYELKAKDIFDMTLCLGKIGKLVAKRKAIEEGSIIPPENGTESVGNVSNIEMVQTNRPLNSDACHAMPCHADHEPDTKPTVHSLPSEEPEKEAWCEDDILYDYEPHTPTCTPPPTPPLPPSPVEMIVMPPPPVLNTPGDLEQQHHYEINNMRRHKRSKSTATRSIAAAETSTETSHTVSSYVDNQYERRRMNYDHRKKTCSFRTLEKEKEKHCRRYRKKHGHGDQGQHKHHRHHDGPRKHQERWLEQEHGNSSRDHRHATSKSRHLSEDRKERRTEQNSYRSKSHHSPHHNKGSKSRDRDSRSHHHRYEGGRSRRE